MRKRIFTIFLLAISFFKANSQMSNLVDTSKVQILRLDLKSARGTTVSQMFDEVKFVPLETTTQSLFGEISKLEVTKDCYIIADQDTRCILLFNLDGGFRTKIKFEKPSPAYPLEIKVLENSDSGDFQVTNGNYVSFFDLNGQLIKKVEAKLVDDRKTAFYFNSENILVKTNYETNDRDYEIALLKDGKVIGCYFPHEKDYTINDQFMGSGVSLTSSGISNEVFYKRFYDYGIYKITPFGISLDYKLIFPSEYSLPSDFLTNKDFINKKIDFIQKNRKIFYGINNVYKSGDNLFFSGACMDLSRAHKRDFIFNLNTRNLIAIQDVEPDSLSFYLPITNLALNPDFFFHGFHLYKNDYLYNSIPSIDMLILKNQNPNKIVKYDAALIKYFKSATKKSNPVLVIIKPKKN